VSKPRPPRHDDGHSPDDTVLVVIPVRNRPRLVGRTLDTVRAQTRPPDEVIVVDDGSDDGVTPSAVEAWIHDAAPPFPARLVRTEPRNTASARNAGLEAGRPSRWVAFLDSDDLWPVDHLARCLDALRRRPDAVLVAADQRFIDVTTGEDRYQDAAPLETRPADWLLQHEPAILSASLLRTDAVRAVGCFDESLRLGEDLQAVFPLLLEGPWLHAPGAPVRYQRGVFPGEQCNQSLHIEDRFLRWAGVLDALLAEPRIRALTTPRIRRRRLWFLWFHAGENLFRDHRRPEARPCFARALRYGRGDRKTWSRWMKCCLPRSRRRRKAEAHEAG